MSQSADDMVTDEEILAAERRAALRAALAELPPACRQLMALLTADPPVPYTEISDRLGIPVGRIGPSRRRCLDKIRRYPAIAALAVLTAPAPAAPPRPPTTAEPE